MGPIHPKSRLAALFCLCVTLLSFGLVPQAASGQSIGYSTYGTPGLIDMPTARSAPDGELTTTTFHLPNISRATLAFQVTPRLNLSFRYAALEGLGGVRDTLFDRSFDLKYLLWDEGRVRPAVAVGLRDFIGTGVYSAEYVVATKTITPNVEITLGLGWGRLASSGGFSNPLGAFDARFDRRPQTASSSLGGQIESTQWFRGEAAFFGGISWQASDRLRLKAEYSSDAYTQEADGGLIAPRGQLNLGLEYQISRSARLHAYYLYGDTIGAGISFVTDPKRSKANSGNHPAPFPVRVRDPSTQRDLGWVSDPDRQLSVRQLLVESMANEGMEVEGFSATTTNARIWVRNGRYEYAAEAVGRTARVLSQILPDSVEVLEIVPVEQGMAQSMITLRREDLEQLEHDISGAEKMLARAEISEAPRTPPFSPSADLYPRFSWGLGPYFQVGLFDPDYPIRTDYGLRLTADYNPARGIYISGSLRHRLGGNIGEDIRPSNSVIQRVRSDSGLYAQEGRTALEYLTASAYFRPSRNLYGRLTFGYLEPMFGGISAELLWKPVDSRFALGAEVNLVKQRDFDQGFGFQDYEVATGHLSAYWELGNGFHAQLDVGRYLAGDFGATVSIDREFKNGWRIGAYATLTDVSFDDFGEGSFDKGIRITIPLGAVSGSPSRRQYTALIQPLARDGGARLRVNGRLYEQVRGFHRSALESSWGRFWR